MPTPLGGALRNLVELLDGPLSGHFIGIHLLPPFPSSGDRGFSPITYDEIDQRLGSWDEGEQIAAGHDLVLDLMVNHISRHSNLDCHDGIPVRPDLDDILSPAEMIGLTDTMVRRGGNVSRLRRNNGQPAREAAIPRPLDRESH